MAKKEYYIEMPLTGMATGTVIAETEEEAIELFAEECTSDNIDWGVDASNATAREEGDEVKVEVSDEAGNVQQYKGGFFDLPQDTRCKDKSHEPPTLIHIPQGKGYRHVCPSCGKVTDLIPPQISF